jgi:drug/metabolite transporter (DMT)-like permease
MKKPVFTYLFLIFSMICWGMSFVWYKQALDSFKPISLVFARLVISFPLLVIAGLILKRLKPINRKHIPLFLLLAFFEPFLYFTGESMGIQYVSSTMAAILIATVPVFTSITAFLFFKEKLKGKNYLGMFISFLGVLTVIFSDSSEISATWKGILLILLSVFSALIYGFLVKKISGFYNPLTIVTTQNIIASFYFLPFFIIFDYKKILATDWNFEMIIPVLYLAIFASTFAYLGFIQGLRDLGVSKATVFTNFIPVVTAIAALLLLNEKLTWLKTSGIVLVVGGLVLSQKKKRTRSLKKEIISVDELY